MYKEKKPGRRIFLNPDPSQTDYASWSASKWDGHTDVALQIADYTHKVILQFNVGTSIKTRTAALQKLRRLQGILDEVREYLERTWCG